MGSQTATIPATPNLRPVLSSVFSILRKSSSAQAAAEKSKPSVLSLETEQERSQLVSSIKAGNHREVAIYASNHHTLHLVTLVAEYVKLDYTPSQALNRISEAWSDLNNLNPMIVAAVYWDLYWEQKGRGISYPVESCWQTKFPYFNEAFRIRHPDEIRI